jgi:hypothetical protein
MKTIQQVIENHEKDPQKKEALDKARAWMKGYNLADNITVEEYPMKLEQLIEQLDNRFGNPNAPSQYSLIKLAIAELRRLQELDSQKEANTP